MLDCAEKTPFDVVAVGASLGGLAAIHAVLADLPVDFPVPILVVQHRGPDRPGGIATAMRRLPLPVAEPRSDTPLAAGHIYVAPPDRHMSVSERRTIVLDREPLVSRVRPAIDVLFHSIARVFGTRSLAVLLTGRGRDGCAGVQAIKRAGGRVIAQDEASAAAFDMPRAAIATGCVDFVMPLDRIGAAIAALVTVPGAAALFRVALPPWAQTE